MCADDALNESIRLCDELNDLLEDDYKDLARQFRVDLYELYKEVVLKEKSLLDETRELLVICKNNT